MTSYAWYELLPAPSIKVKLKIAQGDTIATSVNVNGSAVLVQIKDRTRHTTFTKQLIMTTPDLSSAEWIEEAPSTCTPSGQCRVLPLANFGSISIGKAATIGNGHPGTVSDPAWATSAVQLVPDSGSFGPADASQSTAGATPSALSANGRSFAVTWQASATVPIGR